MLKLIQFIQKRPSDKKIKIIGFLFGLVLILGGYYNLIYQNDLLNESIFGYAVSEQNSLYIKYGIIALGIVPLGRSFVKKCFLPKKYMKYLQLFFAILLFYVSSIIKETQDLDFDTLIVFMALVPLFSGITGKLIPTYCLKYGEKVTKIRV
ncbi:MAG: hypothetical protein GY828_02970 [Candidatus Gracilibacteria bacterium]|nr:hypothetical protein [Candidatus Gracilibacteria bacterium]